ncbi:exocyst complex component 3-like [Scomber scombrus]|uniref:Exocyst complex component 3-like n=1 Tax=Scomber scombrus TaxID=13677 RepID=A0AAV1QDA2_SCOSC
MIHIQLVTAKWASLRGRNDIKKSSQKEKNNRQEGGVHEEGKHDKASVQTTLNTHEEQQSAKEITLQELAELLQVTLDDISVSPGTSEDGSCCAVPHSGQENQQIVVRLIERSVNQHFPKPPEELEGNLQQHLLELETVVQTQLERLASRITCKGLMGCLLECYHRQTIDHLHGLLQNIRTSKNSFMLLNWVRHTYLSQDLPGNASPQKLDHIKNVDLMLFTEWVTKAQDKLLENVQKDVRESLEKILQNERSQEGGDSDDAFIQLNVDAIQCTNAMYKAAETVSKTLSDRVHDICFQELLVFVKKYTTEQTEILRNQKQKAKPDMKLFLKTLQNCEALKQHVQTKSNNTKTSLPNDTVKVLEEMDDLTMKLLLEIVAGYTESHLKNHFKSEKKHFSMLVDEVKMCFTKLSYCQDVQERVMDEVYKLITQLYFKHLVQSDKRKLKKCWSSDVGQQVTNDSELLHSTISDMAFGVQQWNLVLLKIPSILECKDTDGLKLDVAEMQQMNITKREDLELLLRWKGLSNREVRVVLEALPEDQPRPRSELAKILRVTPDDISVSPGTSVDRSCYAVPISAQENQQNVVRLIQRSMNQHFPKPPAELERNLQQHLLELETVVQNELARLASRITCKELMGCLLDCYHHQIIDHLHGLLQKISTSNNSFVLLNWVRQTYLSRDLPDGASPTSPQKIKYVDPMLFTEWLAKAQDKPLENVQKDVRESLEKILQNERSQEGGDSDEAFIQLNVDAIQCTNAMYTAAESVSKTLSERVQEVCFQELLVFVKKYTTEQTEILRNQTQKAKPDMKLFLKTLQNCEALKQHVQTKSKNIKTSFPDDTVKVLEEMKDLTMKLLLEIVAGYTESHLKNYFESKIEHFSMLVDEVKMRFPKLMWCQDVQERVMDEVYKLITQLYFKHLVQINRRKLKKCWSSDVGQQVTKDAELLHSTISDLAFGVQQWNLVLLKIPAILECKDTSGLKLDVASMQQMNITKREDLELLLRWKGLSNRKIREVLEALPDHQPRPRPVSWYGCFIIWRRPRGSTED